MSLQIKSNSVKNTKVSDAIKELQTDSMVKLTLSISKRMRSDFKIAAERNDTNMTDVVIQHIKQYIQQ